MPRAPSREALSTGSSRALNASEVGALKAESDRLLRLEQELGERQRQLNEKEEKWEASIKDMRAQLDVAQLALCVELLAGGRACATTRPSRTRTRSTAPSWPQR